MTHDETRPDRADPPAAKGGPDADASASRFGCRREPVGPFCDPVRFVALQIPDGQLMVYDPTVTEAWIQSDHTVALGNEGGYWYATTSSHTES